MCVGVTDRCQSSAQYVVLVRSKKGSSHALECCLLGIDRFALRFEQQLDLLEGCNAIARVHTQRCVEGADLSADDVLSLSLQPPA